MSSHRSSRTTKAFPRIVFHCVSTGIVLSIAACGGGAGTSAPSQTTTAPPATPPLTPPSSSGGTTPVPATEYSLLAAPMATNATYANVASLIGGAVLDANGYVGSNRPGVTGTVYPDFAADEQRSAFDNMLGGILTNNDAAVFQGWQALQVTYAHQSINGDFPGNITKPQYAGSANMHFFMAWSCHALSVLLQSPYAAKIPPGGTLTYAQLINGTGSSTQAQQYGILPQIKLALDFLVTNATHNSATDPLNFDFYAPNRSIIDANAFAFGSLLLQNYPAASGSLPAYAVQAQWWVNNTFVASAYAQFNKRPLANAITGVFYEGNPINGYGYDSSYQAVATSQAMFHAFNFPANFKAAGVDPVTFVKLAGRFLQQRFYSTNPAGIGGGPVVDDTDDTRTGPTPIDAEGKSTDFDIVSARKAMIFYTAQFNRAEGVQSVSANTGSTLIWGSPPTIFNDPDLLNQSIALGKAVTTYTVYATNSGIQSGATQTLDPQFSISATGLPPGLSLSAPYSYTQTPSAGDIGNLDQGIGMADITGTPTQPGSYAVTLTPTNKYGAGKAITLMLNIDP